MKLGEMGLQVSPTPDGLWHAPTSASAPSTSRRCRSPGFATDFMPLAVALLATADGTSIVTENVFDNRLGFVAELNRMGADIRHEGRHAVVRGVPRLSAAPVRALDVRAGAALVLAGSRGRRRDRRARPVPRRPRLLRPRRRRSAALGADVERVHDWR